MRNLSFSILVLLSISMTTFCTQSGEEKEKKLINQLRTINAHSIESIKIYQVMRIDGDNKQRLINNLTAADDIKAILSFLKTAPKSNISHPHYIKTWVFEIKNTSYKHELRVYLDRDDKTFLYIRFNGESILGGTVELKSHELYDWMRKNNYFGHKKELIRGPLGPLTN